MPKKPTTLWLVHTAELARRAGPSLKAKIKARVRRGYKLNVVDEVQGDGLTWLVTDRGNYYAKKYCQPAILSPVPGRKISTPWGKRPKGWPFRHTYWKARGRHTGDDYAAPYGAKAVAVLDGTVRYRYDTVLGRCALLYAADGNTYWYCHLQSNVANGTVVKAGDKVGEVGATGTGAQGPHLHFEKRRGHTPSWAGADLKPRWF